jgi:thiamine-phosphate pyrophosphorylase
VKPSERRERLGRARLYVVTGPREPRFLEEILEAGVDVVQLRDKDAEAADLLRSGAVFREAADRHGALFILNDRPDLAIAVGADGVHLGQDDLSVRFTRDLMGPDAIIGLSTHSRSQFDSASPEADYLCVGPVWETPTKPGRPAAGLDAIRHAAASDEPRPWFAIGGIHPGNLGGVVEAGARRIVVVRAVAEAASPARAVGELLGGMPVSGARS